ncbi:MAG: LysE family translocator [Planctomycetota bacterium]
MLILDQIVVGFSNLGIQNFWIFLTAGVILNLTPGQDTMYIIGRSVAEGKGSGIASALGISTGGLIHASAATLGLSAILTTSAVAFMIIKLLGVSYLIYLGVRLLLERESVVFSANGNSNCLGLFRAYRRGIMTNVLNPKVAVFFLAFLPQFVEASTEHRTLAFLLLGGIFVFTGTIWCLIVAILSAKASGTLRRSSGKSRLVRRVAGTVFIGLGIKLALEHIE